MSALAKILKSKGAEAIHLCTCAFSTKTHSGWELAEGDFCDKVNELLHAMHNATGLPCVKGPAHLPQGYAPQKTAEQT